MVHIKILHSPFFTPGGPMHVRVFGPGPFGANGPFAALLALLLFVVVIALVALLITLFIRRSRFAHRFAGAAPMPIRTWHSSASDALRILDERFARGEIDAEDYRTRRDLLQDKP
ncbi:MAG: SHOCT domain-containing protein [Acidimicrobiales bacterium]|jgi:putative membrane protein